MARFVSGVGVGTILLEPLEDPDEPSPSTKCCPELAKHLDISLDVDCHRPLVVVLEPEWCNDAMFGDGNPGSTLHIECNGLCRQCSGGVLPQKMLFLEFT